ncbi:helix-turn-helix domain-containing protein [Bacillus sp. 1P10SD]|uniref:helix-turn-helix transcriptional regulator n=1 Tax=Bacillus sp. 1P10SD TaxID=3132265 RepID=UPI0039A70BA4
MLRENNFSFRHLAELTQDELANIVGVRRNIIIRLEAAKYNPSLELAIDISRAITPKTRK